MNEHSRSADVAVHATPESVVWGAIPTDRRPVLRIRSGQTVRIETISQQPLNQQDPATFFAAAGVPADQVLPERSRFIAR